ncbi:hypothetical protein GDO86_017861 [Hymenochirus boettgeri]|uniref:Uncharacterized protein n=1 Tax=Hymenochirus boettgeri TaxID=247094 RepID=A0A8T2IBI7_9PIPI|nr:hypothetical protein GDO86_017861 [Hymenochirus boettgeri]
MESVPVEVPGNLGVIIQGQLRTSGGACIIFCDSEDSWKKTCLMRTLGNADLVAQVKGKDKTE